MCVREREREREGERERGGGRSNLEDKEKQADPEEMLNSKQIPKIINMFQYLLTSN